MRHTIAAELLLVSGALAHSLPEISVHKRDKHNNGQTDKVARGMVKRADTLETTLFSGVGFVSGGAYYANITVGTPPQLQQVLLDTGSSDLYLDARGSNACQSNGPHSCVATDFNPGASSSYEVLFPSPAFNATYGDGSTAIGPYVSDTVCVNDICVQNMQFGLATDVKSTVGPSIGLLGVGFSYGEALTAVNQLYPNMPDALVQAGVINSRLYSLYLNDYEAVTGSILFGGVDTDKYTGDLVTVNMLPDVASGYVDRFITAITGVTATSNGNTKTITSGGATGIDAYNARSGSYPVLLDSGSSAWSVPTDLYLAIVDQYPFIDPKQGVTSCKNLNEDDHLTLTFNGQIDIDVPITEWVTPLYDNQGNRVPIPNGLPDSGDDACAIGIIPSQGTGLGFETCGDAVMRSMYIVYDLDQGQMSLAQAKTGSSSSNVKAVPAGPGGVAKVASNAKSPPINSYSSIVAPSVSATVQLKVSTAKSAVGTATGVAAVPTEAQVEGLGSSTDGSGSGGSGGSGAAGLQVADSITVWMTASVALFAVLGAGLIL